MKTDPIQQEILLVLNTTLSNKQWNEKDLGRNSQGPVSDNIEEACWNGLLDEVLPELIEKSASGKRLFLWQIRLHEAFIEMELSEFPGIIEKRFSIDPHFFLPTVYYS